MSLGTIVDEISVDHLTDEVDEVVLADAVDELRAAPFETGPAEDTQSFAEVSVDLSAGRFSHLRAYVIENTSAGGEINFAPRAIPYDGLGEI